MSARPRGWRPLLHGLHQWTGLSLGLIFVLLGLSGSWLAFYPELDQLLHPEQVAAPGAGTIPLAPVVAALRAAEPGRPGPWRIELPRWESAPIGARYYHPAETRERHFAPLMLTLDPHSLRPSRKYFWGEDPSTWIYELHYTLLLGDLGRTLLGGVAGLLLLLLLSGLLLWWPRPGRWRGALSIKAGAVWKRRIYDWHVKPGVYTLVLMLPLTLTGLMLVVPHWFAPLIEGLGPVSRNYQAPAPAASFVPGVDADQALAVALARFPGAELRWLETPSPTQGYWHLRLYQAGEPSRRFPGTHVWVDAASGHLLALRDPRQNTAGDTWLAWLHPLHNGEAFGLAGRIAICLSGLLPLLALLTGFIRWRHKRTSRARSARTILGRP